MSGINIVHSLYITPKCIFVPKTRQDFRLHSKNALLEAPPSMFLSLSNFITHHFVARVNVILIAGPSCMYPSLLHVEFGLAHVSVCPPSICVETTVCLLYMESPATLCWLVIPQDSNNTLPYSQILSHRMASSSRCYLASSCMRKQQ